MEIKRRTDDNAKFYSYLFDFIMNISLLEKIPSFLQQGSGVKTT